MINRLTRYKVGISDSTLLCFLKGLQSAFP
jgi:hypothetical protein